jgi:hypothetical protein
MVKLVLSGSLAGGLPCAHGSGRRRHREVRGLQVTSAEDGAVWLAFSRDLTARGPRVQLVTSDARRGSADAIGAPCPARPGGGAARTAPRT